MNFTRPVFFSALKTLCLTALLATLAACSPRFDWRDHQSNGIVATFPDKVINAEQEIDLDGLHVTMKMDATRVDDVAFAVGTVTLPDNTPATATRALNAMRIAMLRNIEAIPATATADAAPQGKPVTLSRTYASNPPIPATAVRAEGNAGGTPMQLNARFAANNGRAYQIMVLGPASQLKSDAEQEAVETFLTSVRVD